MIDEGYRRWLTAWPNPNQPDEKFTDPGSNTLAVLFGMKFEELIRQLGAHPLDFPFFTDFLNRFGFGPLGTLFFTDLLSKRPALIVALRMSR